MPLKSRQQEIRQLLRANPDGLTPREIATKINSVSKNVRKSLHEMPDAYIDDWCRGKRGISLQAIWRVVVPPPNAPRPGGMENADEDE